MLGIAIDVNQLAITQMRTNTATTCAHITGGGFYFRSRSNLGNGIVDRVRREDFEHG
jgi:phosphoribosylaminoimidazole (AIR) synthetase